MSQTLKNMAVYPSLASGATAGDPVNITGAHSHALEVCLGAGFGGPVTLTIEQTGPDMDDPCVPDDTGWTDMGEIKTCDSGPDFVPFEIVFDTADPDHPAVPGTCCLVPLLPCAAAFIRVNADVADEVTVNVIEHRLKRNA